MILKKYYNADFSATDRNKKFRNSTFTMTLKSESLYRDINTAKTAKRRCIADSYKYNKDARRFKELSTTAGQGYYLYLFNKYNITQKLNINSSTIYFHLRI